MYNSAMYSSCLVNLNLSPETIVFTLLETLYGEFDRLARARKVFKVEVRIQTFLANFVRHGVVLSSFADTNTFRSMFWLG